MANSVNDSKISQAAISLLDKHVPARNGESGTLVAPKPLPYADDAERKKGDISRRKELGSKLRNLMHKPKAEDTNIANIHKTNKIRAAGGGRKAYQVTLDTLLVKVGYSKTANRGDPKHVTRPDAPDDPTFRYGRASDVKAKPHQLNILQKIAGRKAPEGSYPLPAREKPREPVTKRQYAEARKFTPGTISAALIAPVDALDVAADQIQTANPRLTDFGQQLNNQNLDNLKRPDEPSGLVASIDFYQKDRRFRDADRTKENQVLEQQTLEKMQARPGDLAAGISSDPVTRQKNRGDIASKRTTEALKRKREAELARSQGKAAEIKNKVADILKLKPDLQQDEIVRFRTQLLDEQKKTEQLYAGGTRTIVYKEGSVTSRSNRMTGGQLHEELREKQKVAETQLSVRNQIVFDTQSVNSPHGYRRMLEMDIFFKADHAKNAFFNEKGERVPEAEGKRDRLALLDKMEALSSKQCSSPNALVDLAYELSLACEGNAAKALKVLTYLGDINIAEELLVARENAVLSRAMEEMRANGKTIPVKWTHEGQTQDVYDFKLTPDEQKMEDARDPTQPPSLQTQAIAVLKARRERRENSTPDHAQHNNERELAAQCEGRTNIQNMNDWRYATTEVVTSLNAGKKSPAGSKGDIRTTGWKMIQSLSTAPALLAALKVAVADKDETHNQRYDFYMPVVKNMTRSLNKRNTDNRLYKAQYAERKAELEADYAKRCSAAEKKNPGQPKYPKVPEELIRIRKFDAEPLHTPEDMFGPDRDPDTADGMDAAARMLYYSGPMSLVDIAAWLKTSPPLAKPWMRGEDKESRKYIEEADLPDGQPDLIELEPLARVAYSMLRNQVDIPLRPPVKTDKKSVSDSIRQLGSSLGITKISVDKPASQIIDETGLRINKWISRYKETSKVKKMTNFRHKSPLKGLSERELAFAAGGNMSVYKATSRLMPRALIELQDVNDARLVLAARETDGDKRRHHIAELINAIQQEALLHVFAKKRFLEAQTGHPMLIVEDNQVRMYLKDRCAKITALQDSLSDQTGERLDAILDPDELFRLFKLGFSDSRDKSTLDNTPSLLQTSPALSQQWITYVHASRKEVEPQVLALQKELLEEASTKRDNSAAPASDKVTGNYKAVLDWLEGKNMATEYYKNEDFEVDVKTLFNKLPAPKLIKNDPGGNLQQLADSFPVMKIGGYLQFTSKISVGFGFSPVLTETLAKKIGLRVSVGGDITKTREAEVRMGLTGPRAYLSLDVTTGHEENLSVSVGAKVGGMVGEVGLSGVVDLNLLNLMLSQRQGEGVTLSASRWLIQAKGLRKIAEARGAGDSDKMVMMQATASNVFGELTDTDRAYGITNGLMKAISAAPETINVNVVGKTLDSRSIFRAGAGIKAGLNAGIGTHSGGFTTGVVGGLSRMHEAHNEHGLGQTITSQTLTEAFQLSLGVGSGTSAYTFEKDLLAANIASLPGVGANLDLLTIGEADKTLVIEVDGEICKNSNVLTTHKDFASYAKALVEQADSFAELKYRAEIGRKALEGAMPRDVHVETLVENLQKHLFMRDVLAINQAGDEAIRRLPDGFIKTFSREKVNEVGQKGIADAKRAFVKKYAASYLANLGTYSNANSARADSREEHARLVELNAEDTDASNQEMFDKISQSINIPGGQEHPLGPWGTKAIFSKAQTEAQRTAILDEHLAERHKKQLLTTRKTQIKADASALLNGADSKKIRAEREMLIKQFTMKKDAGNRYPDVSQENHLDIDNDTGYYRHRHHLSKEETAEATAAASTRFLRSDSPEVRKAKVKDEIRARLVAYNSNIDAMQQELSMRIEEAEMAWAEGEMRKAISEVDLCILDEQGENGKAQKREWMRALLANSSTEDVALRETMAENVLHDLVTEKLVTKFKKPEIAADADSNKNFKSHLKDVENEWLDNQIADEMGLEAFRNALHLKVIQDDLDNKNNPDDPKAPSTLAGIENRALLNLFTDGTQPADGSNVKLNSFIDRRMLSKLPPQIQRDLKAEIRRYGKEAMADMEKAPGFQDINAGYTRSVPDAIDAARIAKKAAMATALRDAADDLRTEASFRHRADNQINKGLAAKARADAIDKEIYDLRLGTMTQEQKKAYVRKYLQHADMRHPFVPAMTSDKEIDTLVKAAARTRVDREMNNSKSARVLYAEEIRQLQEKDLTMTYAEAEQAVRESLIKEVTATLLAEQKAKPTADKMTYLRTQLGKHPDLKYAATNSKVMEKLSKEAVAVFTSGQTPQDSIGLNKVRLEWMIDEKLAIRHNWEKQTAPLAALEKKAANKDVIPYVMTEIEKFEMRNECLARVGRMTYETLKYLVPTQSFLQFRELSEKAFTMTPYEFNKNRQATNYGATQEANEWKGRLQTRLIDPRTWSSEFRMTYDQSSRSTTKGTGVGFVWKKLDTATANYLKTWDAN